jgi:regulator of extracellular matrix RemA (YlzA/DUF370 family)
MSADITSSNPIVQAIISGTAPQAARMAAARGLLPLAQAELLEVLVALRASAEAELASAADATLEAQEPEALLSVAASTETSTAVLGYLAARQTIGRDVQEALTLNPNTPDAGIAALSASTRDGSLLELISINQQRLIRAPAILEAIITNAARTPEADRRARETRREFFEKERGAQQVSEELRARGQTAAAEFLEAAESISSDETFSAEDAWLIAAHIEVSDDDIDDSWLGLERLEELLDETNEQRIANVERILNETQLENKELPPERVALIRRIMLMSVRDRVKLGMKGDREARAILVRDSNKIVASAVMHNPRITENEVEAVAAMRTVSDEVLRIIALNRTWARSYPIIHNLVRNPRTPIATAIGILPRIRTKDLQQLTQNRNVSEAVRRQGFRLLATRTGK